MTCVVLQLTLPAYRQAFLDELERRGSSIEFLVGDRHFVPKMVTEVESNLVAYTGTNIFLLGRRLAWQRRVLAKGISAGHTIIEVNPRILTSWIVLPGRQILRRRTTGWGHVHSRGPRTALTTAIRLWMLRLCSEIIVYTETEARAARALCPRSRVAVAANAVYCASDLRPVADTREGRDLIMIGRLVDQKNPLLGLEAFRRAVPRIDPSARLHIVGDGPLRSLLELEVATHNLDDRVVVHGEIFATESLRKLFSSSSAMLCAGYVGLNVIQALGFGIPVIHPLDAPHAPESEALDEKNSVAFDNGDVQDCARAIESVVTGAAEFATSEELSEDIRNRYSVERMVLPFLRAGT